MNPISDFVERRPTIKMLALSFLLLIGFTLVGAALFSFTRMRDSPVPQEAIIGIVYVVASAAVILVAGFTAEGAEHIKETLTGTLIWIDWPTIYKMGGVYLAVGVFHWFVRHKMLAVSFAPDRVARLRFWDFLFYVSFGIAISFSVDVAGVLMVFSSLVIPGVAAFLFTNRFGVALVLAWTAGAIAVVGGIAASFVWDVATGPLLVCSFGAVLLLAFILRAALGVRTGSNVVVRALEPN